MICGRKPKLTRTQALYVRTVGRIRRELPSVAQLAKRFGVSMQTIRTAERNGHKRYAKGRGHE